MEPKNILWSLMFLKTYDTETNLFYLFVGVDEKILEMVMVFRHLH